MTTEEKAKRYDETLERLKGLIEGTREDKCAIVEEDIIDIFPELVESDDEKIRKDLIEWIKEFPDSIWRGHYTKDVIAWLEKQTPVKFNDEKDEKIRKELIEFVKSRGGFKQEYIAWLEKQVPKPKFHEGDWITNGNAINHISKIRDDGFYCFDYGPSSVQYIDNTYHLWTIEDAKEGDVLVYGDNPADHHLRIIMLFKSMRNFNSAFNHFHIFDDEFRINEWCDCGKTAHPATKEQRDLLFAKMNEAGYEWDAEKKELRKIEKQGEQKSAWSEEDERERKRVVGLLEGWLSTFKETCYAEDCKFGIEWLKSLKKDGEVNYDKNGKH